MKPKLINFLFCEGCCEMLSILYLEVILKVSVLFVCSGLVAVNNRFELNYTYQILKMKIYIEEAQGRL